MIGFGVVGVGGYGVAWRQCLETLEQRGLARIAAVTDANQALLAELRPQLEARGVRIYASLDAMLAGGRDVIDIIGLPVGIASHAPLAIRAMQAGYNVFTEKPAAATVQDVLRMQAAERSTGRWCAVDYQYLHSPVTPWVLGKLTDGSLGRLLEARVRIDWPRPQSYYDRNAWAGRLKRGDDWVLDGPATNAVAHHLTQLLYWASLGQGGLDSIAAVRAELYRAKPIESYDTSCIEVRMSSGARVLHLASHAVEHVHDPEAMLLCEGGRIFWYSAEDRVLVRYADGREETYVADDGWGLGERGFVQVARVAAGLEARPVCGLTQAAPQVLAVNLAFESSGGVSSIAPEYVYEVKAGDGSPLLAARGLDATLASAFERGQSISAQGAPWARATEWVSAAGYRAFPRAATLS